LKRRKDKSKRNDWRWMMSEETFKNAKKNDFIIFDKNKNGEWNVRVKTYQFVDYKLQLKTRLLKLRSILTSTTTQDGRKCLEELDIKTFDYPKPPKLISDLLKCFDNQNATVLDFFAGSGTTGQSVIESNQEDKGKRKFILCNNNDKDDRNPNGIAYDTTYNRLRKIVNNDSLNVYTIETNNCISKQIFEKINPEDYDINDKKTIKQKIE
jgi:adenine-specific DNA-methyltransferase